MEKKRAIIVDLDGTLYDCKSRRDEFLGGEKKNFDGFNAAAKNDLPHEWCLQLCQAMRNSGFAILFVSGREDTHRPEAVEWIRHHLNWRSGEYVLEMRPAGNYLPDVSIKHEILRRVIRPAFDVLFAVDDRKCVADFWREQGITCLHCDEGDF